MQVWQLFHILQDYCAITNDSSTLYCNMTKYLLQKQKIHGEQSIYSLTLIDSNEWRSFFRGTIFSDHHVQKFATILRNINEYLNTHGIVSVIHSPVSARLSCTITKPMDTLTSYTVYHIAIGIIAGFGIGYLYAGYIIN